ncbi:hypothetical protein C8C85_0185 [Flavobacterium sp. 103]|uniref:guanylate kinase n=1 Tax=unclassified Flavobacterium TaxID=196869 RepID=UPI000D5E1D5F|nr:MULTISPECIES: guanylate kinase [unclassified Flavobacterium]PVX44449.1 hypothetical protein C8C85_0185 [Flavobacterium sp. 103]QKJ63444.1 guanylate kinase [Flavobacterium sp. M31R6]
MEIRNDCYAKYRGGEYRFFEKDNSYRLQASISQNLLNLGFKKYTQKELKEKIYIDLDINEIVSAYQVSTYCKYKGFVFFIENSFEDIFTLLPLKEAQEHFRDFPHHGYDPSYEAKENEMEEIWEERKPIEGFAFDVEPIFFIKKKET